MWHFSTCLRVVRRIQPNKYIKNSVQQYTPGKYSARSFASKRKKKKTGKGQSTPSNQGGGTPGVFSASITDVRKVLPGGRVIFDKANLSFFHGAKIGILGPNGAGKSSLLRIIAGTDKDYDGTVWRKKDLKIGYLEQEPILDEDKSCLENVMDGIKEQTDLLAKYDACNEAMCDPEADFDKLLEEQGSLQSRIDDLDCWNMKHDVDLVMNALNCPPDDAKPANLSGGEKRRVALARLLLERPEML